LKLKTTKERKQKFMKKSDEEIVADLNAVFREVLDNQDIALSLATVQDDIEEWDSLAHIQLVLAIGRKFGVQFTTQEVVGWDSVSAIVESVRNHLA